MLPYFCCCPWAFSFNSPALLCQVTEPSWGSGWHVLIGYSITCCTHPTSDIFHAFFSLSDKGSCTHRNAGLARTAGSSQHRQAAPHCQDWEGSQLICLGYSVLQVRAGSTSLHLHTPVVGPRPCSAIPSLCHPTTAYSYPLSFLSFLYMCFLNACFTCPPELPSLFSLL